VNLTHPPSKPPPPDVWEDCYKEMNKICRILTTVSYLPLPCLVFPSLAIAHALFDISLCIVIVVLRMSRYFTGSLLKYILPF